MQGRALSLVTHEGGIAALRTQEGELECDAVILATGGLSYPATGSTGDGYRMARAVSYTHLGGTSRWLRCRTW